MQQTVLITGASSGIGLELAKIFANNKFNLVLVARSEDKLKALAQQIKSKNEVNVHVITQDLSKYNNALEVYNDCKINGIKIDYLINNAGFGDFGLFADSDWKKQEEMINLNITALTYLTKLFLPSMIENNFGNIVNVASTAAFQPGPTMAVYYATKAFVLYFTEAINNELQSTGVTATALCPGATESGFQNAANLHESKLVKGKKLPTSNEVAIWAYQKIMQRKTVAIHGLYNYIQANAVRFLPRNLVVKITRKVQDK